MKKLKQTAWIWGSLALLAVAILILVLGVNGVLPFGGTGGMQVVPTMVDANGSVQPDSRFVLQGSGHLEEPALRELIDTQPEFVYGLLRGESGDWELRPAQPFAPESEFTLKLGSTRYTAKVAPTVVVTTSAPKSGSQDMGTYSGVELTFNTAELTVDALQKALVVSPDFQFHLTKEGNRVILYPQNRLQYGTTYSITLRKDAFLQGTWQLREDFVLEFRTTTMLAEKMSSVMTMRGNDTYNTLTSETPVLQLYLDTEVVGQPELSVKLYQYPDVAAYRDAVADSMLQYKGKGNTGVLHATTGLIEYASFAVEPIAMGEGDAWSRGSSLLPFPDKLPEGWYLAEITCPTKEKNEDGSDYLLRRYKLIQSSDLSVFFMHSDEEMVLWANDAATGKPAEGAIFAVTGAVNCNPKTTDKDGVAVISDASLRPEQWGESGIFTLTWQGHTFVDGSRYNPDTQSEQGDLLYQSTLFTDRPLYRTTDTLQIWGYLRPRRTETPMPKTAQLVGDGIDPVEVTLNERGQFTATIPLQSLSDGYLTLDLRVEDKSVRRWSVRVYDYIKPQYSATLTADKPVYLLSQNPQPVIDVNVGMFDGTPAPEWKGYVDQQWDNQLQFAADGRLTTDREGNAAVVVTSIDSSTQNSWYPQSSSFVLRNEQAEEENFMTSGYIHYIPRDLMLQTTLEVKDNRGTVMLSANRVDISGITTSEQLYIEPEKTLRGEPIAVPVTAKLQSVQMVKTQSGVSYDYINRVSVPRYEYNRVEKTVESWNLTTDQNGALVLPDLPCYDKTTETWYFLQLSAKDSAGRLTETTVWLYPEFYYSSGSDAYNYSLNRVISPDKLQNADGSMVDEWNLRRTFGDGETANFHLYNNNEPVAIGNGRILYATVQDRFENIKQSDREAISIPFAEQLLPNYMLAGAYFDGKHVFILDATWMSFDASQRELEIEVAADKTTYTPGEAAELSLTVTEKATGKPAADADVVVAVVDEAIFALEEQYVNPLGELYSNVFYPTITFYASFNSPEYGGAGEKGGGGGNDAPREKFPDTALFATATTDSEGRAKLSMTLPDSITSWRITALALTQNGHAGNDRNNIIATKDFYVMPIRNAEQLAGDTVTVGLRGAGRSVEPDDTVSYSVTLEGNGVNQTQEVEVEGVRKLGWASFDTVPAGDYTVTVRGSCGSYTDAVKLPISVVASGIEVAKYKTFDLAREPLAVTSLRYPVTIALYDKQYALYNQVVSAVGNASTGIRADMRLARVALDRIYSKGDPSGSYSGSGETAADLRWNPLRLFPTDQEPDLRLTAYAYLALPNLMGDYAGGRWNDATATPAEPSELAAPGAFYILQSMSDNLPKGQSVDTTGYKLTDLLDLAVARHLAGDTAEAQKTFETLVLPNLQKSTGLSGAVALSLPATDGLPAMDCTAAASRLATVLGRAEADDLMRYLVERPSRYDPYIIEKLLYLSYREAVAATNPATISYTLRGKQEQYTLSSALHTLSLTQSELAGLNLKVASGEVLADLRYTIPATEADPATKKLKITKTIAPVNGTEYRVGDLVKVTLTPDLSGFATDIGSAELLVDDYLPAGMKFEKFEYTATSHTVHWSMVSRQEQRLRFSTWDAHQSMQPIVYYARNAVPGSYVIEGTFVSSGEGDVWGSSDRGTVTIQP